MYLAVTDVKPQKEYILLLTFENEEKRLFDMKPYLNHGVFKELKNINIFNTVKVNFDTIEWINEADFDPEALYLNSTELKQDIIEKEQ